MKTKRLDMKHWVNVRAYGRINWEKVRATRESISTWMLFKEAICNEADCPIGYKKCGVFKPTLPQDCWYYDILKTVENVGGED